MPAFPHYLNTVPQMPELQSAFRQARTAFDTGGAEKAYGAQMAGNVGQAQSTTGNMARAAANRAFRTGGAVNASFAAGSAMLPYFQQNNELLGQLEDYKLRAAQNKVSAMGNIGEALAGFRQRQMGMLADYDQGAQNRAQQESQFGRSLGQRGAEFNATHALNLRQQGFAEDQYDDQLSLRRQAAMRAARRLPSQGNVAAIMSAMNYDNPAALHRWQNYADAARFGGYGEEDVFGTGNL